MSHPITYVYPTYADRPTWNSWSAMHGRCKYKSHTAYKHYGGRGIRVCRRWHYFSRFLDDMGRRPEGTTLDRINVNGKYEPSNCRWATPKVQANNKRNSKRCCSI